MYAASRDALAKTRSALQAAIAGAVEQTAAAAQTGAELFSVVEVLDSERTLRVALGDSSAVASARTDVVSRVFTDKVSTSTFAVLNAAVAQSWSKPSDLVNSLELLGQESLLQAAAEQQQLDTVEDELFRLGRIVAGNTELEQVFSDRAQGAARKRELLATLLYGKVTAITVALASQAVSRSVNAPADAFDSLSNLAAAQRDQTVARVSSAVILTAEQETKLSQMLERTYGRKVTVHVEVKPELVGGLVIRVGDEVIDGSTAGRLAALRKNLQ
ncbi:MAG: F0F1 ATP synthase subunit delta [Mycobacteriaceae bacterium]